MAAESLQTNLGAVLALHGLEGDGFAVLAEDGDERIDQSRIWALWAPQLRERIYEGLALWPPPWKAMRMLLPGGMTR